MRQIQLAKMDLLMHVRMAEFLDGDIEAKARATIADCMVPTEPPARTVVKRFNHVFSDPVGYAAGYYSYKWAEVLDADAFTRFKNGGVFSRSVGDEFRRRVLERGDSEDAAALYKAFMGREPSLDPLLERSGLAVSAA